MLGRTMYHKVMPWLFGALSLVVICCVNLIADCTQNQQIPASSVETTAISRPTTTPYLHREDGAPIASVHVGEDFFIHSETHRNQECRWTANIALQGIDNRIATSLKQEENWSSIGDLIKDEKLTIPSGIVPGNYHISKKIVNYCGEQVYLTTLFDALVQILPNQP